MKTEWNVTSKVRSEIPATPEKFAKVVKNLIQRSTPRKRKALDDLSVKESIPLKALKKQRREKQS